VGFISWQTTSDANLLILAAFVVSGEDVNAKTLAKILLWIEIVLIFSVVSLSFIGVISSSNVAQLSDGNLITRYSLGFTHPNRLGSNLLAICCAFAVIQYPNFKASHLVLYAICALITYFVAFSRTSTLLIAFVPVVSIGFSIAAAKENQRPFILLIVVGFAAMVMASLYVTINFDPTNSFMQKLNGAFSGRPYLANYYYRLYGVTAFGRNPNTMVQVINNIEGVVIDNAYSKLLIVFGYIPSILFYVMYVAIFIHAYRSNHLDSCLLGAFIYACVGVTEWQVMHFAMNYCLIGFSMVLFGGGASRDNLARRGINTVLSVRP
jgi:hypothetical protein